MLPEEVKPGLCYINAKNTKHVVVRKVLSIADNRVNYEFLYGSQKRHGLLFNSCTLRGFSKWATEIVEELPDYKHLTGFIPYKNYTVLSVSGKELLKSTEKKIQFYLRKGMLKWVDENTLQFTTDEIESKLLYHHGGKMPEYMMTEKNTCCVVCGTKDALTKHHIVPKKDLPNYPLEIKKNFCNLLAVCRDCHSAYEIGKEEVIFEGYTYSTAISWMNHFIEIMKPRFLPKGWHILTGRGKILSGIQ